MVHQNPRKWTTYNDKLHTIIVEDNSDLLGLDVKLEYEELPILKCVLENSFFLITTNKLVSNYLSQTNELLLKDFTRHGDDFEKENFARTNGEQPKINKVVVKGKKNNKLIYLIDSHEPAYFAKTLIMNMTHYINNGTWFWNPRLPSKKIE